MCPTPASATTWLSSRGCAPRGVLSPTAQPVRFTKHDVVEIVRSDAVPCTVTTMESVVFSPYLYLDDMGNDSRWIGTPTINLRDYGRTLSGEIGFGLAFLMPGEQGAAVEWMLPPVGPCLVSANVNRGPSRAESIPLEIQFSGGKTMTVVLEGKNADFGRSRRQDIGVVRDPRGAGSRFKAARGGCVLCRPVPPYAPSRRRPVRPGEKTLG